MSERQITDKQTNGGDGFDDRTFRKYRRLILAVMIAAGSDAESAVVRKSVSTLLAAMADTASFSFVLPMQNTNLPSLSKPS